MVSYPGGGPPPSTQSFSSHPQSQPQSLQYMDNVMSRFGHHMSANERSSFSQSMVPTLQSSAPAGTLQAQYLGTATAGLSMPTVHNSTSNNSNTVNTFTTTTTPTTTATTTTYTSAINNNNNKPLSPLSSQMDLDNKT